MRLKYTPGPWIANVEKCEGIIIESTVRGKMMNTNDKYYDLAKMFNMGEPDIAAANAVLIAAAPDMLDTLMYLDAQLPERITGEICVTMEMLQAFAMVRAAIAQATGGE